MVIILYVLPCCCYCYYHFCYCNCNSSYNDIWNTEWAKLIFFFSYSRSEKDVLSSFLKFRTKQIASKLTCKLGSESEVKKIAVSKTQYEVRCPYRGCNYRDDRVKRHLCGKEHRWMKTRAVFFKSRHVWLFNFYTKVFHSNQPKPLPCQKLCR